MKLWALRTVSNMSPTIHDSKSRFLIVSSKVGRPFRFGASYPETEVLPYSISLVLLNAQHLLHARMRIRKVPDMMRPRGRRFSGVGAGAGAKSANGKNILCVFKSRAMVLAPGAVFTVSSTLYLSGDS